MFANINKTIVLMGKMGSGKTTLKNLLLKKMPNLRNIITYTTRPMRPGEIDGTDYHFIDYAKFKELNEQQVFAEHQAYHTIFGTWFYGSPKDSYGANSIIVLEPNGIKEIKESHPDIPMFVVYLSVDNDLLKERSVKRGDNPEEIERRLEDDDKKFSDIESICDLKINISEDTTPEDAAEKILEYVNEKEIEEKIDLALKLKANTPDGYPIKDSDTILADLLESCDFAFTGISEDVFNIYKKSTDKKSIKELFYELTDTEFEDYLDQCCSKTTRSRD